VSPPPGVAEDGGEQAGDLGRVGLATPGAALAARLVADPVGTLAAGRGAVPATAPGGRPAQRSAAHETAWRPATDRARFVTRRRAHAIASAISGTARPATMPAMA